MTSKLNAFNFLRLIYSQLPTFFKYYAHCENPSILEGRSNLCLMYHCLTRQTTVVLSFWDYHVLPLGENGGRTRNEWIIIMSLLNTGELFSGFPIKKYFRNNLEATRFRLFWELCSVTESEPLVVFRLFSRRFRLNRWIVLVKSNQLTAVSVQRPATTPPDSSSSR